MNTKLSSHKIIINEKLKGREKFNELFEKKKEIKIL